MRTSSQNLRRAGGQSSSARLAAACVSAFLLLFPRLAAAETRSLLSDRCAQEPAMPTSRDALLHHQLSEAAVAEREMQRYGRAEVERRQREAQTEIDRIYADVMSRSAPADRQISAKQAAASATISSP
jgi:hypothetical protein